MRVLHVRGLYAEVDLELHYVQTEGKCWLWWRPLLKKREKGRTPIQFVFRLKTTSAILTHLG